MSDPPRSRSDCLIGHTDHAPLTTAAAHAHGHDPHGDAHSHENHHHDYRHHDKAMLLWSFVLTVTMMMVEIVAGLFTESLALVSDGVHMFTHAFAPGISWGAIVLATRPVSMEKSFGYHRIEVVAAFTNGITILASAVWILYEAAARFYAPREIQIVNTLYIAVAGLIVNLVTGAILMRADQTSLNIKSVFLHMLTDALSSVAIIIGLIVIYYTAWEWIDPLLAVAVAAVIVKWSWSLLRDSLHILLEGSPVDVRVLKKYVLNHYPEIVDLHDVHVWQISQRFNCLTAHLHIHPDAIFGYPDLPDRLNADLREHFEIGHTNFQPEWR
jgi:cobalt-zinc-cadmium efflux system protein